MTLLVGRWDCNTCGHIGNLGPDIKCIKCGASRPENVRFYLPENAEEITDEEEIRKAEAGSDWICDHCGSHNTALDKICKSCGNKYDVSEGDKHLQEHEYNPDEVPTDSKKAKELSKKKKTPEPEKPKKLSKGCLYSLIGGITLGVILVFLAFFTKDIKVKVISMPWERQINAERYMLVTEEAWDMPEGGKLITSRRDIHHYDEILTGYETRTRTVKKKVGEEKYVKSTKDLGNGRFKKIYGTRPVYKDVKEKYKAPVYIKKPVYATKYKYSIRRWQTDNTLVTKGNSKPARWYTNDSLTNQKIYRIKDSTAVYSIVVTENNGKQHTEKVNFKYWSKTDIGQSVKAVESSFYGIYIGLPDEAKIKD